MGVRGLTTYVARYADHYLKPYELHDTSLVIDGDNLACNLYKDVSGIYSAFGGDYDDFYRGVLRFFAVLAECRITPFVLMDGGYQNHKMKTVVQRMRNKISVIKRINPAGSVTIFPPMLKEVFVDALYDLGIPVMRCVFEADDELASLSRVLDCPVLSYDSDFYIHDVCYIPLVTLTLKAYTKVLSSTDSKTATTNRKEGPTNEKISHCSLRKCEVRKFEKLTRSHTIVSAITLNNGAKSETSKYQNHKSYKYLKCCMYRNQNFMSKGSLSPEKLPLLATVLGNDYISRSYFRSLYMHGLAKLGRCTKSKNKQRRIIKVMKWLRHETTETAMEKILNRIPQKMRPWLRRKVEAAMKNYNPDKCYSYDYFHRTYPDIISAVKKQAEENEKFNAEQDDIFMISSDEGEILEDSNNEESNMEDFNSEEEIFDDFMDNADDNFIANSDLKSETEMEEVNVLDTEEKLVTDDYHQRFPGWFLEKLNAAKLPRFYVDLVHLRKYINNPIIEHFAYEECNKIAVPIICYVFTILQKCKGAQFLRRNRKITVDVKPYFTYLTRQVRCSNVDYIRYEMSDSEEDFLYDPEQPDNELLRSFFKKQIQGLDCDRLFDEAIMQLPKDLQLYFLAIVYWLQKSNHCKLEHLYALIICLIVLRTIDSKIGSERDLARFAKRYGKIIAREKAMRACHLSKTEQNSKNVNETNQSRHLHLKIPERMGYVPKSDCYLVQNELLKHFHMPEIFKKKYDQYSSIILHSFSEFQSVLHQLYALNSLLDCPYQLPHMAQLFCGVFLYNIYNLIKDRLDVHYYVRYYIFQDSQMMYEFYEFLWHWCEPFIPSSKRFEHIEVAGINSSDTIQSAHSAKKNVGVNRKLLRKKRQKTKREHLRQQETEATPPEKSEGDLSENEQEESFFDINNKFTTLLKF